MIYLLDLLGTLTFAIGGAYEEKNIFYFLSFINENLAIVISIIIILILREIVSKYGIYAKLIKSNTKLILAY